MKVIIVGGVAGGASAAARLRRLDEKAQIILFERGAYISYANCGLPYYIGGAITDREELTLQTPESFRLRFRVDVRVNTEVVSLHPKRKTVSVYEKRTGNTYEESYDKLILSPGASPVLPPVDGLSGERVFTVRTIPDTDRVRSFMENENPQSAVILGGGFIGLELAENLMEAGLRVTVIERADQLVTQLDYDVACELQLYANEKGLRIQVNTSVQEVEETPKGLKLKLSDGTSVDTDMLFVCTGVRPESGLASAAQLACTENGCIVVDDRMRTSDVDIYAVGDAVAVEDFVTKQSAHIPLAGPANRQGRIAADNICGLDSVYGGSQGSAIFKFFDQTVAMTGLSERTAKGAGFAYEKVYLYQGSHAGYYPGSTPMSMKVIFDTSDGRILGAQIVGSAGVDKRCDVLATLIRLKATYRDMVGLELCYAPPFSSAKDPVNMAGFVIENIMQGHIKQFHWHDVDGLPRDGSVTLLDVRHPSERRWGSIDGFMNIEVDNLREQIDTLPADKPIYVHCQSGLRSYIACRILQGYGYTCFNLAGGYRLYSVMRAAATLFHGG